MIKMMHRNWTIIGLGLLFCSAPARADEFGLEIARQHAIRAGDRLAALQSYSAEGWTMIGNAVLPFQLWAARPNRLRVESTVNDRKMVQCFDGSHQPWLGQPEAHGGAPRLMGPAELKDFISNADFDGPLVNPTAKGYTVDYAGEDQLDGHKAAKLLVMSAQNQVLFMWVDSTTHEVVKRSAFRISASGERQTVETFFSDFREVGGVLQPHRIETKVGLRTLYVMIIAKMVANDPQVTDSVFTPPPDWPAYNPPPTVSAPK